MSYAFNADSNNQLDASNEAEVTGTGSAYGSSITTPFILEEANNAYVDGNTGYVMATGFNGFGSMGNGTATNITSWYQLRKNNNATTSPDGTPKASETGYFSNPRDYALSLVNSSVIDEDGAVWGSGYNEFGQLGQGTTTTSQIFQVSNITEDAVKIAAGVYGTLVLMDDGSVMSAGFKPYIGFSGSGDTLFFTETIDRFTTASKRGIVDMAYGENAGYILFGDGDLWYSSTTSGTSSTTVGVGSWALMASNIKMFDCDGNSSYIYAVTTANVILYQYQTDTKFSQMPTQPKIVNGVQEEVMQIRGAGGEYAWGYLTTDGDLYLSSTAVNPGAAYAYSEALYVTNDVSYFDLSGQMKSGNNFGYIDSSTGNLNLWGANSMGELSTGDTSAVPYASRKTLNIGLSAATVPNINAGIFNTPPDASPRK